ncbi:hypothetical protein Pint_30051 [Pistacia integerrima]|uniref:Uncharacterized protein n=2 Tax=Pistacia TaxID=55512 RepID=A0ACC0X514_9ROSI|nr:hypothetical protein Pint_30051 [Pistacia integerrima]
MSIARKINIGTKGFGRFNRFISNLSRQNGDDVKNLPALSNMFAKQDQDRFESGGMYSLRMLAFLGASVSGLLSCATVAYSDEAEHGLACPNYPWPHKGILSSYDHAS